LRFTNPEVRVAPLRRKQPRHYNRAIADSTITSRGTKWATPHSSSHKLGSSDWKWPVFDSLMIGPQLKSRIGRRDDRLDYAVPWDGPLDRMIFVQSENKTLTD
jgi:hypothetical protein